MRIAAVALAAFLLAPAAGVAVTESAMIPVEGEGAKDWPRGRGPSGQGLATGSGSVSCGKVFSHRSSNDTQSANASAIVISINDDYSFTSAAAGVTFDIDGDGDADQIAWTDADSEVAFLARDADGDGQITNGRELFGNYTVAGVNNGFAALAVLAARSNGNVVRGSVSQDDPIFFDLLLWTDRNHNGVSEPSELRPLRQDIAAIGLGYMVARRKDRYGNILMYEGWLHVRTAPGRNETSSANEDRARRRAIWDVFLMKEP